ncbi:conserved hypothetical protein [Burkholderia cenocepacia]|nr:conserved hypothetical protein [Burkholderia cenocepacia]
MCFIGNAEPNILLFQHNAEAYPVLDKRIQSLQIDRIILSFLLSPID